jgi:transcription initiation factor TFIID subunit 6
VAALAGNDNAASKPLVKHVVSKELILFFDKIRGAILDEDPDPEVIILRKSALESIRSDPGLHQLVPYFVQFVSEKVTHSLGNLFVLQQMMELTQAMTENDTLHVDPYVSGLAPPILTCLLGRKLGNDGVDNLKDQYQLRDLAASLIGHISNKYASSSGELQARLARTCLRYFLDPSRTLAEQYGAINGLRTIGGPSGIQMLVLPNLKAYDSILEKAQREHTDDHDGVRMLIAGIMKAIVTLSDTSSSMPNGTNSNAEEGEQLVEYLGKIIGSRVAAMENHKLNKAILDSREKH